MLVSADRRRIGEIGLLDARTGEAMPVEAIAGKILSDRGELTAVVTILHDRREAIEKARLYEQLKQASDELERKIQAATADIAQQNELLRRQAIELEQASALKSQFLANMSHEFRTPLNAMLGYTSMLLQGVAGAVDVPIKRQLSRIESNGRHLLTIINEILDISRIEAGRMPLQMSKFMVPERPVFSYTSWMVDTMVMTSPGRTGTPNWMSFPASKPPRRMCQSPRLKLDWIACEPVPSMIRKASLRAVDAASP